MSPLITLQVSVTLTLIALKQILDPLHVPIGFFQVNFKCLLQFRVSGFIDEIRQRFGNLLFHIERLLEIAYIQSAKILNICGEHLDISLVGASQLEHYLIVGCGHLLRVAVLAAARLRGCAGLLSNTSQTGGHLFKGWTNSLSKEPTYAYQMLQPWVR